MTWYYELFDWLGEDYFTVLNKEQMRRAKKEVAFILKALALQGSDPVLDLCCGIGRHAIPLGQRGLAVTGLDHSNVLLAYANNWAEQQGVVVKWVQGDMRRLPFGDDQFQAVVNLWTSFGYLENDQEHLRVLQEVARVLRPDGAFLLDVPNRDWIMYNLEVGEEIREIAGVTEINHYDFDSQSGRDMISTRYIYNGEERKIQHSCRLFTYQELDNLLQQAGLEIRQAYGGYDGRPVDWRHKQLILLCGKKE